MRLQSHSSEIESPRYCMISCNLGAPEGAERRAWPWQWRGEARCATCFFVRVPFANANRSRTVNFSFSSHSGIFSETSAPNVDVPLTSRVWKLSILAHAARARRSRTTRAATPQNASSCPALATRSHEPGRQRTNRGLQAIDVPADDQPVASASSITSSF